MIQRMKARFTPFTAMTIMLMIVVIFGANTLILTSLQNGDIRQILQNVNQTTTGTNFIADQIAEVFLNANRTNVILDEIKETNKLLTNSTEAIAENLGSGVSRQDEIVGKLDNITSLLLELS